MKSQKLLTGVLLVPGDSGVVPPPGLAVHPKALAPHGAGLVGAFRTETEKDEVGEGK